MSFKMLFIAIFCLSVTFVACHVTPNASRQILSDCESVVTFDTLFLNLGTLKQGEEVGKAVWVKNVGDCPWVVEHLETACGCITVQYGRNPLPPKDSMQMQILFNSQGFNGQQIKMVTIFDNSSKKQHDLIVVANIEE
ncbi:MAG: DUF1573 domain-containing protein [Breznakibacter sp.]